MNRRHALATIVAAALPRPEPQPPRPHPQWDSWAEVAEFLARWEHDARTEYRSGTPHIQGELDWDGKGVRVRYGTGTPEQVSADLADALTEAGGRTIGEAVVCRGQAWAIVLWEARP